MRRTSVALLISALTACGGKSVEPRPDAAELIPMVAHDVSPPLRDIAARTPFVGRQADEIEMEPVRQIPHRFMRYDNLTDAVVQSAHPTAGGPIAAPTVSFDALGTGLAGFSIGGYPPDTDGDVSETDYVQVVNTGMAVFTRTGTVRMGPMDTGAVWQGFTGQCAQTNDGDATVRYDHIAKRWVIAQFSLGAGANGPFYQCVAVSTTSDPTGTYARYQFNFTDFPDYPKMGVWSDAYYFTFNMFPNNGFAGAKICALDKTKLLTGAATTQQCFDTGPNYGGALAADIDGASLPPAGAPEPIIALDSNTAHAYWKLHVDFTTPTNSTFSGPTAITVSNYTPLCNGGTCVREPSPGPQLDSLADRAMNRFVYRRFADHESLLLSHSVTANTSGGVRWYEFRNPTTPTVFQQGTFAPDATYRWMPSIAMDGAGDIALVYTASSTTVNPSVRYAARAAADPAGTLGAGEGIIIAGTGTQRTGISRWGDYSSINIDPKDDCTFWATNEYEKSTGAGNWSTRVAAFTLPSCSTFALGMPDAEMVDQGSSSMSYPVTTSTTSGAAQTVTLSATGLPAGVTATFNPATVQSGDSATVTLTADSTAMTGSTHYTITAMGTTSSQMADVALTVNPKGTNPGSDAGNQGSGGDDDGGGAGKGGCCEVGGNAPMGSILLAGAVLLVIRRRRR